MRAILYRVHARRRPNRTPKDNPVRAATRPVRRCGTVILHGMTHEAILHEFLSLPLRACVDMRSYTPRNSEEHRTCDPQTKLANYKKRLHFATY